MPLGPAEVAVLNCCVTDTNATLRRSNVAMRRTKSAIERVCPRPECLPELGSK